MLIYSLLLVFLPPIAVAQPFVPFGNFAPAIMAFRADGGDVKTWARYLPCESNTAHLQVKILRSFPHPVWLSGVIVALSNNPKDKAADMASFDRAVRISLTSDHTGRPQFKSLAYIELQTKERMQQRASILSNSIRNGQLHNIDLKWTETGIVTASIDGGLPQSRNMDRRITTLGIFTSGAQTEIHNLQVGRTGPKPSGRDACGIS